MKKTDPEESLEYFKENPPTITPEMITARGHDEPIIFLGGVNCATAREIISTLAPLVGQNS